MVTVDGEILERLRPAADIYPSGIAGTIVEGSSRVDVGNIARLLADLVPMFDELGVQIPSDVTVYLEHAESLRVEAKGSPRQEQVSAEEITRRLGRGDITPAEADKLLAKTDAVPSPDQRGRRRRLLLAAATFAERHALAALQVEADALIAGPLATVVRDALARPGELAAQREYDSAHEVAMILRRQGLAARAVGASANEYRFARPDLVHLWLVQNATEFKHEERVDHDGTPRLIRTPLEAAPLTLPLIAEHPEWEAGLLSAQLVVDASSYEAFRISTSPPPNVLP